MSFSWTLALKGCTCPPFPSQSSTSKNLDTYTTPTTIVKMEPNRHSCDHAEEDYIYMEVGSQSAIFSHHYSTTTSISSSPHAREFEFQMSSSSERDAAPSPADELFYKGKLLPLHLPPRLQMVETLLQNANINSYDYKLEDSTTTFEECFSTPLFTNANNTPTANNTPFESCNISPSESCQVSRELNPEEYLYEYSTEASSFVGDQNPKSSWTKKLKLIKQSSLGSKLKASRSYLKSLFSKSACSSETCAAASRNHVVGSSGSVLKANECVNKYVKVPKKAPFGQIQNGTGKKAGTSSSVIRNFDKENFDENGVGARGRHRRSFSGAIKRISMTRSSSSLSSSGSSSASSSTNSNGFRELPFFKRSNSVNSDIENPIQAAIAHCKSSQQLFNSRKTVSDLGFSRYPLQELFMKIKDQDFAGVKDRED